MAASDLAVMVSYFLGRSRFMATAPNVNPPPLTPEGLRALSDQLDSDLNAVTAQGLKPQIEKRVSELKAILKQAAEDLEAGTFNLNSWNTLVAPKFNALKPLFQQAFNLNTNDQGACRYQGGCIVTTAIQCSRLMGNFTPGGSCP
jgi:hypothetical protein